MSKPLTIKDALQQIKGRAGAPQSRCNVYWSRWEDEKPRLVHVQKFGWRGGIKFVIVGARWLRLRAPQLWAPICAARLFGVDKQLIPTQLPAEYYQHGNNTQAPQGSQGKVQVIKGRQAQITWCDD